MIYESYTFFSRKQHEGESITAFIADLKTLSNTCNFGLVKDRLIRDQIACGIRSSSLRQALPQEGKLTLSSRIAKCKLIEAAVVQSTSIAGQQQAFRDLPTRSLAPPAEASLH